MSTAGSTRPDAKTSASEDRSEAQIDGANREFPPEARTGASGSRAVSPARTDVGTVDDLHARR